MGKLHVDIDQNKMNQSKTRTIQQVMATIDMQQEAKAAKRRFRLSKESLIFAFLLVIGLFVMISVGDGNVSIEIKAYETEEIANVSYLTAGMISMSSTVNELTVSTSIMQLGMIDALNVTDFEDNIDTFNCYFDMLRVYVDQVDMQEVIVFEELTNHELEYKLSYVLDNQLHEFYIIQIKSRIIGELLIEGVVYQVEGSLEEKENEIGLQITAFNGEDFVSVAYSDDMDNETDKTYHIEQKIGDVVTNREISIRADGAETKVYIKEDNAEYEISKTVLAEGVIYEVVYKVGNQEGEVEILITIDEFGNEVFIYGISEDGEEIEIELEDPDEDDEHHDEDDEDEDDEDDDEEEEEEEEEEDPEVEEPEEEETEI